MKRPQKNENGEYTISGKSYKLLVGSRRQVWNEMAYKTSGNLTKKDLVYTKHHRIVSRVKHESSKKEKRLEKAGYFATPGKFGFVKRPPKTTRKTMKNKKK